MTKKRYMPIVLACLIFSCIFIFTGCFGTTTKKSGKRFGEFGYSGKYLTDFATQTISISKAKQILQTNLDKNLEPLASALGNEDPDPNEELVDFVLTKYSGCEIYTKYYVSGKDSQQTKQDSLLGTDFKSMLELNEFTGFSQLVTKYVLAFPELIDTMEVYNQEFKDSEISKVAPFSNRFTYHTDSKGQLVIQTRDFSEIASSVGGGIGCSYRQDTELLYDSENKLQKWQTSLGLFSATPLGTMKQGYILEVEFNWILKN